MAYITNYEYYLNNGTAPKSVNHGSYQDKTLADLINSYMLIYVGPDKVVDNVSAHVVKFHAKQAIKELNYDAINSICAIETKIGSDLKLIMPADYVNWVRISMEKDGVLYPLSENTHIMSADAYLRDNANELLFDGAGEVLTGSSELDAERLSGVGTTSTDDDCSSYSIGAFFGLDTEKANGNPGFRINKKRGVIDFDSRMSDELVVLEYISDGMENNDDSLIGIHKFYEKYVYAYISSEILESKEGVSDIKIRRAMRKKSSLLRNCRIRSSDLHPARLLQTMLGVG